MQESPTIERPQASSDLVPTGEFRVTAQAWKQLDLRSRLEMEACFGSRSLFLAVARTYAAIENRSASRSQLATRFHLGKIWSTKFPSTGKRMQARRLSGSIA